MDKVLKQRLVGAAILIALAVIFVPMLFDGSDEPDVPRDAALDLPPPPADRDEVRRLPLEPARVSQPPVEEPAEPEPAPEPVSPDPEAAMEAERPAPAEPPDSGPGAEPTLQPEAETEAEPASEPDPAVASVPPEPEPEPEAEPEPSAPAEGDWQVQVASFGSAETAEQVTAQLEQLGHNSGSDLIVRGETRLHRVWTGPYADRAAAERARAQIAATVAGVEPLVRNLPGSATTAPAAAEREGFAVQVGSFADQSNADRQLDQLLEQGFDAFIHADETGSRPIWRVRVGAFARRDQAAALQRTLREQAGLEGLVVSHP